MASVLLTAVIGPALAAGSVRLNSQVGKTYDGAAGDTDALRYIGNPAPTGYSHDYQWGTPQVTTPALEPNSGTVILRGNIRLKNRKAGSTAMIGLFDRQHVMTGGSERQQGATIYVHTFASGTVRIGVSDGNVGGEVVLRSVYIPAGSVPDGVPGRFTIDGTTDLRHASRRVRTWARPTGA